MFIHCNVVCEIVIYFAQVCNHCKLYCNAIYCIVLTNKFLQIPSTKSCDNYNITICMGIKVKIEVKATVLTMDKIAYMWPFHWKSTFNYSFT